MDIFDRAAEVEALHREAALAAQRQKSQVTAPSAENCESCGEAIPDGRREAIIGCMYCVVCKEEMEKYEKTRFFA